MKMVVLFDVDADIIDVPEHIIENRDRMRSRFLRWLYDKSIKHKYWTKIKMSNGDTFLGLCYRSDAFVEWLNRKELRKSPEKAKVLEQHVGDYPEDLPMIFF